MPEIKVGGRISKGQTSSAQLRLAQISSALIEYLIKLSSDSYLIRLVQKAQFSTITEAITLWGFSTIAKLY